MYSPVVVLLVAFLHGLITNVHVSAEQFPAPAFTMNLTQDANMGVEKRTFRRLGDSSSDGSATAPMFEGLGTHYSFIWVGTPAQRVSVIMDTGSHHTAFPCMGCKCGKHMDPYFDPQKSSTSVIKSCGQDGKKCIFKQSYTEGSSWSAFKVRDKVWVGGPGKEDIKQAHMRSIDFDFGCQESETGLFRTQKVDGIMGLSAAADTLPFQLQAAGLTKTKMFGLCFRTGGGVVTLGGVDTRLHLPVVRGLSAEQQQLNRTSMGGIFFAGLTKAKGWYTVKMIDVLMRPSAGTAGKEKLTAIPAAKSIGGDASRYNAGKGTIVDSGTTDTYLPATLRSQFQALFRTLTGKEYSNKQAYYSKEQFAKLPVIVFRLMGERGEGYLDLEVFPSSYMEHHKEGAGASGGGRYTPRIYLTEGTGAVLGANAINEHNVIFDPDGLRVGFARSLCTYDKVHSSHDFATSTNDVPKTPVKTPAKSSNAAQKTLPEANNKEQQPVVPAAAPKKGGNGAVSASALKKMKAKEVETATSLLGNLPLQPSEPKPTPPTQHLKGTSTKKPAKPTKGTAATVKPSQYNPLFPVPLTPVHKENLASLVAAAADSFVSERNVACRRVLTMPCNARCDRPPSPEIQALDFGVPETPQHRRFEYLQVNKEGEVSVGTASVMYGQEFWRVPSCAEGAAARRSLESMTSAERGLGSLEDEVNAALNFVPQEGSASRIVAQKCSVVCPRLEAGSTDERAEGMESNAGITALLPVRVNTKVGVEETVTACDVQTQTKKHIDVSDTLVPTLGASNVLTVKPVLNNDRKVQCFSVSNAASVKDPAPTSHSEANPEKTGGEDSSRAPAPSSCKATTVVETSCRPYVPDCTHPTAAFAAAGAGKAADPVVIANEIVVVVHLRLQGLHYDTLPAYQEADLLTAFANIFKLDASRVSLTMLPPVGGFPLGTQQASVQVYLRVDPVLDTYLVPEKLQQMVTRISAARKVAKRSMQAVQRSLLSQQVAQLVQAVVNQPTFPEILASAVLEAYPTEGGAAIQPARHGWLVPSGISVVGASALHGGELGPKDKANADKYDADTCAALVSPWKAYFGFGSSALPVVSLEQDRSEGHTFLLYFAMSSCVCLTLLGAGFFLVRRFVRERERSLRERSSASTNSSSGGSGGLFKKLGGYFQQEPQTPEKSSNITPSSINSIGKSNKDNITEESDEEAPQPQKAGRGGHTTHSASQSAHGTGAHKSHQSAHHDRRRKVLQKFAVKR